MTAVRDQLARISARPPVEWTRRLEAAFPDDAQLRTQALLWLHAEKEGPELEGVPPSLGEAADERYELMVRLATGATSAVWQAYDRRLGRNVAIKVFHEREASDALEQVLAEARAASDVVSEHVVRVLDVHYGDGHPYIVMELVSEYEVAKAEVVLGTTAAATRPSSIDEVARWVMHVARGVHEAHLRNVFHRDLKPKNVLITPHSRRARVADFGLAVSGTSPEAVDAPRRAITLLRRGPNGPVSVRGTPEYMAPEQARGLPLTLDARTADDRAVLVAIDVWGLGAIAYELLSGRPPWLARAADDLSAWEIAASTERPAPLDRFGFAGSRDGERIPRRLRRVIEKAMAIDPRARYATAAALGNELQAFLARRPTTLDRSRALRIGLWGYRNPQLALSIVVAVGLTGTVAGTHATVMRLRDDREALDHEVREQRAEQTRLGDSVTRARRELDETRARLASERQNLTALEASLAAERASYAGLIEAKEQALRDATASTRKLVLQLESARRDRNVAVTGRTRAEQQSEQMKRDLEAGVQSRDRLRRERDTFKRERDAAIAERVGIEKELQTVRTELLRHTKARSRDL